MVRTIVLILALFLLTSSAGAQSQYSWGYIGCSNTRDTITGYHAAPGTMHLFWPGTREYELGGGSVELWADARDKRWREFDEMMTRHNRGMAPQVVWVQLCVPNSDIRNGATTYETVKAMLANLRSHARNSKVYVSPLPPHLPTSLCSRVSNALPTVARWADQIARDGLALRGPGNRADNLYPLGPLTRALTADDECHPTGPTHGQPMEGSGSLFLGTQLSRFFDYAVGR